ncbi:MAG: hypothetical protein WCC21_15410 [Candidatus Acidiferrales bacterium]
MDTPSIRRGELAPLILFVGDLVLRLMTYAEHLDFILSVRDEKLATMLQLFKDSGWWIVALASAGWFLYEWKWRKENSNSANSVGALVFSAALVAFLFGALVAVSATGTLPTILQVYAGDGTNQTCNAQVDTSKLVGFQDGYHLILLCGVSDPKIDAQEDNRIAISSGFHINGGPMDIVAPFGQMIEVWKDKLPFPPGQGVSFTIWHTLAVIPADIDPSSIKRASDVEKVGGRILTLPIGGWGSGMTVGTPPSSTPAPTAPPAPTKNT